MNLKLSSDRLVIVAKGFLKPSNLHMLIKQKSSSVPRNLSLGTFGKLSIFNKGNFPIPHLFNGPEVLSSPSDKAKLFAEKFS